MTVDPRVFRAYDIRALVPYLVDETSEFFGMVGDADAFQAPLEPDGVELIGRGIAELFGQPVVAVGADSRLSSPAWKDALAAGLTGQGVDVIDLGLTTTDTVYFVSGAWNVPGVQITASHCTRELNGMKLVRAGAHVVGQGCGMEELRAIVLDRRFRTSSRRGELTSRDPLPEYVEHLMRFCQASQIRPLRILADAGNGAGGLLAQRLFERLPQLAVTPMYFEPDGRFPNHVANPFEVENVHELIARIPRDGYELGIAWDGDADRVFFFDETGSPVAGDFITALIARYFLNKEPGAGIVYDLRSSWAVRDWVRRQGGRPIPERVGHSYIKQRMRAENAAFGGEVSGHYYFRDHWFADNGYIPVLAVLAMLSESGDTLSRLVAGLGEYYVTGEINSKVPDNRDVIDRIAKEYADADLNYTDGISVNYPNWHFNVRPSANDPVVRLNLEARSRAELDSRRDEVLALIRSGA